MLNTNYRDAPENWFLNAYFVLATLTHKFSHDCVSVNAQLVETGHAVAAAESSESMKNHEMRECTRLDEEARKSYGEQKARMRAEVRIGQDFFLSLSFFLPFCLFPYFFPSQFRSSTISRSTSTALLLLRLPSPAI